MLYITNYWLNFTCLLACAIFWRSIILKDHSWHLCKILLQNHVLKKFETSSTTCKVSTISSAESTSILSYFWNSHTWIFQIARELYKQILLVTSTLTVKKRFTCNSLFRYCLANGLSIVNKIVSSDGLLRYIYLELSSFVY